MTDNAVDEELMGATLLDDAQQQLCRPQANESLLLAIETPDDATTISGIATGWQALAEQIDRYHCTAIRPRSRVRDSVIRCEAHDSFPSLEPIGKLRT
jgi:hypothetical protein